MGRFGAIMAMAFVLTLISSAFALDFNTIPYKMPAKHRIIYQISTSGITENSNIVVTLTIPESVYAHFKTLVDGGSYCEGIGNQKLGVDFGYPVVYYLSSANTSERSYNNYEVLETYDYAIAGCSKEGAPVYVRFPKTIRVTIPQLDEGQVGYANLEHYIVAYIPFVGVMLTGDHDSFANYSVAGSFTSYGAYKIMDLGGVVNIPISTSDHVYLAFNCDDCGVSVTFEGQDGKKYRIYYGDLGYADGQITSDYTYQVSPGSTITANGVSYHNVIAELTQETGKPASFFKSIYAIEYGASTSPYFDFVTDIYLFKYPS